MAGIARVALVDGMGGRSDKTADRCRDLALVLCADCVSRAANVGVDDGDAVVFFLKVVLDSESCASLLLSHFTLRKMARGLKRGGRQISSFRPGGNYL